MSKPKMTEAAVKEAMAQGAKTTHDIAHDIAIAIGYGGKTGVVAKQTLAKIKALIPKSPKIKLTPKKKTIVVKAKAPKETPPLTVKQVKSANPFGNTMGGNSMHRVLFNANSKKEIPLDEAVTNSIILTGRNADTVRSFLRTLSNPADRHNGGKSVNIAKTEGNIHLAVA